MNTARISLTLDIRSYWLHARGEGGGADFDLVMERDNDGLPVLRGRHLAGLLRLALERAVAWRWLTDEYIALDVPGLLMGSRGEGAPGCLDIRSARIARPLHDRLTADKALREACFQRLSTTAIDGRLGVAKEKHLRSIEAALPLPLVFSVGFDPFDRMAWAGGNEVDTRHVTIAASTWHDWIRTAWPALDEVGAKRTRGFGRLGMTEPVFSSGEVP